MRTVAIIQARATSSRFPRKMLAELGGYPLLEWVLKRVCQSKRLDHIVLATSDLPSDDPLAEIAARCGVQVFRGDEQNVLQRFVDAARLSKADRVVRVCGDNPFIDPVELDRLIEFFDANRCDYACNHMDRLGSGYADGFGAEVFNASLLETIAESTGEARHLEHVTLYVWDNADKFSIRSVLAPAALAHPHLRFDVDTASDLEYLANLVEAGVSLTTPATRIVEIARLLNTGKPVTQ